MRRGRLQIERWYCPLCQRFVANCTCGQAVVAGEHEPNEAFAALTDSDEPPLQYESHQKDFQGLASPVVSKRAAVVPAGSVRQIDRVLEAVNNGATTSAEIAVVTGLSVKTCSSHLSVLHRECRVTKEKGQIRLNERGMFSFRYRPPGAVSRSPEFSSVLWLHKGLLWKFLLLLKTHSEISLDAARRVDF